MGDLWPVLNWRLECVVQVQLAVCDKPSLLSVEFAVSSRLLKLVYLSGHIISETVSRVSLSYMKDHELIKPFFSNFTSKST